MMEILRKEMAPTSHHRFNLHEHHNINLDVLEESTTTFEPTSTNIGNYYYIHFSKYRYTIYLLIVAMYIPTHGFSYLYLAYVIL